MLTKQHVEEDLSKAYVQAVAARAGLNLSLNSRSHDYTIDGTFHQINYVNGRRHESGFSLDFQLKATKNLGFKDGNSQFVQYDLDAETYNYLVDRSNAVRTTPAILIVFSLPENEVKWLDLTEDELILRRCCYWIHLTGEKSANSVRKRISIPKENILKPVTVLEMMKKIEEGRSVI